MYGSLSPWSAINNVMLLWSLYRHGSVPEKCCIPRHLVGCSLWRGQPGVGGSVPAAEGRHCGRCSSASKDHSVWKGPSGGSIQIYGSGQAHWQGPPAGQFHLWPLALFTWEYYRLFQWTNLPWCIWKTLNTIIKVTVGSHSNSVHIAVTWLTGKKIRPTLHYTTMCPLTGSSLPTGLSWGTGCSSPNCIPGVFSSYPSHLLPCLSLLHHHWWPGWLWSGARSVADRERSPQTGADFKIRDQER